MGPKLDKLTKRVHATEEGISSTKEREAETKRSMNRDSVGFIFFLCCTKQGNEKTRSHCTPAGIGVELDSVVFFVQLDC